MSVASKSAYLQTFDKESKDDQYSFLITNEQAKMKFEDSRSDRPMEFKAASYKFKTGNALDQEFDLDGRMTQMESDISTNASDPLPGQNQAAIAALDVAYKAKDSQIEAAASAAVTRASQAEVANAAAIQAEETRATQAEQANAAAVVTEAGNRAAAVSAEQTRAEGVEASLQQQITNLLANNDV